MKGTARRAWLIFGICAFVLLTAVSAMSLQIVRADRQQEETEVRARLEGQVRLALWRLDSRVTPLLAGESARSHESFVNPEGEPLAPEIKLRFASRAGHASLSVGISEELRREFEARISRDALDEALPRPDGERLAAVDLQQTQAPVQAVQSIQNAPPIEQQRAYGDNEYLQRKANLDRNAMNFANSSDVDYRQDQGWLPSQRRRAPADGARRLGSSGGVSLPGDDVGFAAELQPSPLRESVTSALWVGEELLLARRTQAPDGDWIEGAWIDWPHLRGQLESEVADLFPDARLVPVREEGAVDRSRMLATLPLRLEPGIDLSPLLASSTWNLTRVAVGSAWLLVLFVLGATAALLRATLDLSERRGAFVSAVTHELRTPLTTFRMYTEMLSEDMVTDEAQRSRYIETLRKEAHRLDNLVENVLTYARIEDERAQVKVETHRLGDLVDDISARLRERAEQAEFEFTVDVDEGLRERELRVDRTALEQVLFNLVDNAAKYGAGDARKAIDLSVQVTGGRLSFSVRDHGLGIPERELTKVFRPFEKAEAHEAGTLPGVGLGLALCQRLAQALGGDLRYARADPGARFTLRLPRR